jgi:hypothetical protein
VPLDFTAVYATESCANIRFMTILDRLAIRDGLYTYDEPVPWWGRYVGLWVPLVTLIGILGYFAGGLWRVVAAACVLILLGLLVAAMRWERKHKRPAA